MITEHGRLLRTVATRQSPSRVVNYRKERTMNLLELAECCDQATGPDQGLDIAIHTAVTTFEPRLGGPGWPKWAIVVPAFPGWKLLPEYTASIDAAMMLMPSECKRWELRHRSLRGPDRVNATIETTDAGIVGTSGATASLALCAAILHARALASVGRNPEGHDRETGHGPQDEHAVAATSGETPSTKSGAPDNG